MSFTQNQKLKPVKVRAGDQSPGGAHERRVVSLRTLGYEVEGCDHRQSVRSLP